jgi:MFS transporter, DHA2 family, multidrug resistance protein
VASRPKTNPWLIAIAVMLATFMEVMDTSIASVAVPYIAGSTASTTDEAEWVLTVYLVANAAFLLSSNYLSEKFGRKRFLMFSVGIFTVASFLCGVAPSLSFILQERAIQGAGGGALQPLSQAILIESFPPEQQGMALGVYALGVVIAPVVGPAFGGYLTDAVSWRWAFYINIPIGIAAILMQSRVLEDPPEIKNAKPGKFDGVGFGLLGIWVACLQYVLDKGQEQDWFGDIRICWGVALCVIFFIAYVVYQLRAAKPLVNLRSLRDRNLGWGCFLIFCLGGVLYGLTTILPVFYQNLLGYSATRSGFAVSPRGVGSFAAALVVGAAVSRFDARWIVAGGFAVLGISGLMLGEITLNISPWTEFWPLTLSGVGLAMIFVPLSKVALGTIPKTETGNASGIFNFLRNVGGSIGISVANTISQRHSQAHRFELTHWFTGSSWLLRRQLNSLTASMARHAGPHRSYLRALSLTNQAFNNQASVYAYVDVLRYFGFLCIACAPLAFFLKKTQGSSGGAG